MANKVIKQIAESESADLKLTEALRDAEDRLMRARRDMDELTLERYTAKKIFQHVNLFNGEGETVRVYRSIILTVTANLHPEKLIAQ